jgi:hypothetical protein
MTTPSLPPCLLDKKPDLHLDLYSIEPFVHFDCYTFRPDTDCCVLILVYSVYTMQLSLGSVQYTVYISHKTGILSTFFLFLVVFRAYVINKRKHCIFQPSKKFSKSKCRAMLAPRITAHKPDPKTFCPINV